MDQSKRQSPGWVLNSAEISCETAYRGQRHNSRGVKVLFGLRIVVVSEAYGLCQFTNRRLITGQKMPACASVRSIVETDINCLFSGSKGRFLGGIEDVGDDFKLSADVFFQFFDAE